jgi:hypothetical protein
MCVIIKKKAGVHIPPDMLELACDINKDGFGLSWVNKKKLVTIRDIKKNDHTVIRAELEKHKDIEVFLHLRHSTVGVIDLDNSHPFFPLEEDDGLEVGFMHNGTLFDYVPAVNSEADKEKRSDSYQFSRYFLRPFLLRMKAWSDLKRTKKLHLLGDYLVEQILSDQIGTGGSVFLLFDNLGNSMTVDGEKGKEYDWGWASNTYSFDAQHFRSSSRTPISFNNHGGITEHNSSFRPHAVRSNGSAYGADDDGLPWGRETFPQNGAIKLSQWEEDLAKMDREDQLKAMDYGNLQQQIDRVGSIIRQTDAGVDSMVSTIGKYVVYDSKRQKFLETAGLRSYAELFKLTRDNLENLTGEYPKAFSDLILDLLKDNKELTQKISVLELEIGTNKETAKPAQAAQ